MRLRATAPLAALLLLAGCTTASTLGARPDATPIENGFTVDAIAPVDALRMIIAAVVMRS